MQSRKVPRSGVLVPLFHHDLPYEAKTPYIINTAHYLDDLIVRHLHEKLNHISIKQTLIQILKKNNGFAVAEISLVKFWKLVLKVCFWKLLFTTGSDNLGLLCVKPIFVSNKDSSVTLNKVWVTLHACGVASLGII